MRAAELAARLMSPREQRPRGFAAFDIAMGIGETAAAAIASPRARHAAGAITFRVAKFEWYSQRRASCALARVQASIARLRANNRINVRTQLKLGLNIRPDLR